MPVGTIEKIGRNVNNTLAAFGDFSIFCARTFRWLWGWFHLKNIRLLMPLMYEVGVRSVPVIAVTGAFIGMVMAVETHTQFKALGQEERIGSVIGLSVVKQIGPVLAAVMLAGRIGGAIGLISCYKGFTCGGGASGVGRACTESFVTSFIAIIVLNFFFAQLLKEWYLTIYGVRGLFG